MQALIIFLVSITSFNPSSNLVFGKTFGEPCNRFKSKCDLNSELECNDDGICSCGERMVWDEEMNMCVAPPAPPSLLQPPEKRFGEMCDYIRTCNESMNLICRFNYCTCTDSTFWDIKQQKCIPKEQPESVILTAKRNNPCNGIISIENGTCLCLNTATHRAIPILTMVPDAKSESCVSTADPNSICYSEPIDGVQYKCIENADCVPSQIRADGRIGYCICGNGLAAYEDGTCRPIVTVNTYGASCNSSHHCNQEAIMYCNTPSASTQGTCTCIPSSNMFWNENMKACVGHADSSCNLHPVGGIAKRCTEHASCIPRRENGNPNIGYCACLFGFHTYADRTCGLPKINQSFNESCNASFTCNQNEILSCNFKTKRCNCKYEGDIFDVEVKKCLSPKGNPCFMESVKGQLRECVKNTVCVRTGGSNGTCNCRKANSTGHCIDASDVTKIPIGNKSSSADSLFLSLIPTVFALTTLIV